MVYYEHVTTPFIFGALLFFYYFSIPAAFILWFGRSYNYLRKGNFKLKRLALYLFIAFVITSLAAFKMVDIYLYLHSPMQEDMCLVSSCVLSSPQLSVYHIPPKEMRDYGVPAFGLMRVIRVYDVGTDELGLQRKMDYVAVLRPLVFLPVVEVNVYYVKGRTIVKRDRFYVTWPRSPGGVLSKNLGVSFTVIVLTPGGGGEGGV